MSGHRDPTANAAVGRASKGYRTFHVHGCWVDGGAFHHGRHGWSCGKCAALSDDREADLLLQGDRLAGGR